MYQAIRIYTLEAGSTEAFQHRVRESFVPLIRQQAGFIAYNARRIGTNRVRTISTFETRAGAESSVLLACAGHRSTGKECFPEGRKRAISACVFAV